MSRLRQLTKALQCLQSPIGRRALRLGIAPSFEHRALLRGLGPLSTIIDVGANVGQFAALARIVAPNVQVHSFEPLARPADRFARLFQDDPQVTLYRYALGDSDGTRNMFVTARDDSSSLLEPQAQSQIFPGTETIGTQDIQIARLADLLDGAQIVGPALLKIDVQGFEGEVLNGASPYLPLFDWIYCEISMVPMYRDQPLAPEIIRWLDAKGFRLASVTVDPMAIRQGRCVQADFLFLRAGLDALVKRAAA